MKIFIIGQKGIPVVSGGGVEKHVEDLSVHLADLGHDVFVYCRKSYVKDKARRYKEVRLINLPSIRTKNLDAISHTFLACLDLIFSRKPDIVHFHSIGPSSLLFLVKLFKPRAKVFFTFHCQDYYHQKWGKFARWYLKLGEKLACRFADKVFVVSKELTNYIKKTYNIDAVYMPNGVNIPQNLEMKKDNKWGLEKGSYIVAISRLVKGKGLNYLISAYKKIKTDKKLVIVGGYSFSDDYAKELKNLASGNNNIIFTGNQSGDDLSMLFSNAYLFVQPSESEGLSVALLEAMSHKSACLASNIPSNLEAIEEPSYTFKSKDENDLKEKLEFLIKSPDEVDKNKEKMFLLAKRKYDWQNISNNIVNCYQKELGLKT
jgi:glycosyltransferase involved in cell wall biosynthesis